MNHMAALAPTRPGITPAAPQLVWHALQLSELFGQWPEVHLRALQRHSQLVHYGPRELVMSHSTKEQTLLCVLNGCLEVSSTNTDGDHYVHNMMGAGTVLPLVRLLDEDSPAIYDYYASSPTDLVRVPIHAVKTALAAEPALWKSVAELALKRQQSSLKLLHKQVLSSPRQRLASLLSQLAQAQHTPGPQPCIELNQTHLAAMLGTTRQTVNKALRLLAQEGLLELQYSRILILNLPQLKQLAA